MNDITALMATMKAAAEKATPGEWSAQFGDEIYATNGVENEQVAIATNDAKDADFIALANPANVRALVEALEARDKQIAQDVQIKARLCRESNSLHDRLREAEKRIAELESRTVTEPQSDYFASLVAMARVSADKAMRKFPQPNYVLLKVAEEAGEVVQAGVHYAEKRMEWEQVEGEIVQLLAMLIRLVTEGDQINGVTPPAAGIQVIEGEGQ